MASKPNEKSLSTRRKSLANPPVPSTIPDGGWGWVVTFASFMISVLVDGTCFSQGIFFNDFRQYFRANKSKTSWIGSTVNGSYLVVGPFVGMLANRFGCRKIAFSGAILASASFFASTFSPNIEVFTFIYGALGGMGFGLMYLPAIVMVGYYFEKKRALATGIACCGSGIGMFVFAPLSEFLITEYNWQGATWIISGLVLNGVVFSLFYRPLEAADEGDSKNGKIQMEMTDTPPNLSTDVRIQITVDNGEKATIPRTRSFETNLNKPVNGRLNAVRDDGISEIARMAKSHDGIPFHRAHAHDHHHHSHHKHEFLHPLERKDIFYSGSIMHLKEYTDAASDGEFTKAMFAKSQQSLHAPEVEKELSGCQRACSGLRNVFDVSLMKSPTFLLYCMSCLLTMAGFFVPFTYIPPLAVDLGIPLQQSAFLISIIGITNTVGRVVIGFITDQPWADALLINNFALIIAGVATILVPFYSSYGLLAAYVAIFGLGIAVFVSLRSIIMVELMGLERLTSAFGLVIMFQGLSSYIGAPIAGSIADTFGNYNAAFYLAGAVLAMAGVICLPLRRVAAWENARAEKHDDDAEREAMMNNGTPAS